MDQSSSPLDDSLDFATLLEESFEELDNVERGDLLRGTILTIDKQGILVDVGLKRDGIVPRSDVEALGDSFTCEVGQEVLVMVVKPEDQDGNLVVSIRQALASKDWDAARRQMERGELYEGTVIAANQGGLIVPYGEVRGFVPASHVLNMPRGLDNEARIEHLSSLIGQTLTLKIIEVNPQRRRLVLSQREAQRELRNRAKEELLNRLNEGDIVRGRVSSLRDFGAFVDLGGAEGLIHVSELAWRRIRHPSEVLSVGMEVEAFVMQLDHEGRRIGLSLKRLQPNPWVEIEQKYRIGDLIAGTVSRVVSFGAFVELENGIEALLHISQLSDPPPERPEDVVQPGDRVVARIITLEPHRQRMGLSLKSLTEEEVAHFLAEQGEETAPTDSEDEGINEALAEADTL
ncbi:MAG TPA: S1 RNA-binding domain-containing protein [Chloroflexi bacterium]|nr:S1 RNA-binding domain-containing protein [Chloroflexota bacterium]